MHELEVASAVLGDRVSVDTATFQGGLNGWDTTVLVVLPLAAVGVSALPLLARSADPSARTVWTADPPSS